MPSCPWRHTKDSGTRPTEPSAKHRCISSSERKRYIETLHCAAPICIAKTSSVDPATFAVVINATSLRLNGQGPLPGEVARVSATSLVADVVMVPEHTPLLQAAQARGVGIVYGQEMLTR